MLWVNQPAGLLGHELMENGKTGHLSSGLDGKEDVHPNSCLFHASLLLAAITRQASLPDASSMFFTPSRRLLMFIKDSVYGILFSLSKWFETMLCSHFPEI